MNVFQDSSDLNGLSREGYYFIGGLMKHMKAVTCITNPTVNSYKRFVPGYEAPVYMGWSSRTRGPLIRVPSGKGVNTRIELRSPDAAANPYLALAVLLAAGMDGIRNQIMPPECIDEDIQKMTPQRRAEPVSYTHLIGRCRAGMTVCHAAPKPALRNYSLIHYGVFYPLFYPLSTPKSKRILYTLQVLI